MLLTCTVCCILLVDISCLYFGCIFNFHLMWAEIQTRIISWKMVSNKNTVVHFISGICSKLKGGFGYCHQTGKPGVVSSSPSGVGQDGLNYLNNVVSCSKAYWKACPLSPQSSCFKLFVYTSPPVKPVILQYARQVALSYANKIPHWSFWQLAIDTFLLV